MFDQLAAHLRPVVVLGRARPKPVAGLRAAVATGVPLVIGTLAGAAGTSYAGRAGFLTVLADKGGSYRTRATAMGALAITAPAAAVLGAAAAGHAWLQAPLMLAVSGACGFALAYGAAASSVGTSTAIMFAASLAAPADGAAASRRPPPLPAPLEDSAGAELRTDPAFGAPLEAVLRRLRLLHATTERLAASLG
jgi:hypothetical protein